MKRMKKIKMKEIIKIQLWIIKSCKYISKR